MKNKFFSLGKLFQFFFCFRLYLHKGYSISFLVQFGKLYDLIKNSFFLNWLFGKIENFNKKWNVFNDSIDNLGFLLQNPQKTNCILE